MPGLSLVCDRRQGLHQDRGPLQGLDRVMHTPAYQRTVLVDEPACLLACTHYPNYGLLEHQTPRWHIALEGHIYGKSEATIQQELEAIAPQLFRAEAEQSAIVRWLFQTDGEFLLFVRDKQTGQMAFLNDALGKLPVYYCAGSNRLLVSREISYLAPLVERKSCSRRGLMQFLVLRYCLAKQTPFEGVERMPPASVLRVDPMEWALSERTLFTYDVRHREHEGKSLRQNIDNIRELLVQATVNRASRSDPNVLSLSGGIDSRLIAAILRDQSIPFHAATFIDSDRQFAPDASTAEEVAKVMKLDWKLFDLPAAKGVEALSVLRLKSGLMSMTLGLLMKFLEEMGAQYGWNMVFFTGDTGYGVRKHTPKGRVRRLEDLVTNCIFGYQSQFDLPVVADLLDMDPREVFRDFCQEFESYPETALQEKYQHFIICERILVWNYDGMDRDRSYYWLAAPLDATPVFHYGMNMPYGHRDHYQMYWDMLDQFAPESMKVNYAPYGAPPRSRRLEWTWFKEKMYFKMPEWVRQHVRRLLNRKRAEAHPNPLLVQCLREQMSNGSALKDYFRPDRYEKILQTGTKMQHEVLLSATCAVENFLTGQTTLEKYRDQTLM